MITHTHSLLDYKSFTPYSLAFIETGSAAGDGIQRALDAGFKYVASIEAKEYWHHKCQGRFEGHPAVKLFLGRSTDMLPHVLAWIISPAVIFLDAHPSGEASAGHAEWVKDPTGAWAQDSIIKAELKILMEHPSRHLIIIDDVNGMSDGHAQEYVDIIRAAHKDYKFYFYDENLSGELLYKDKVLVAVPQ